MEAMLCGTPVISTDWGVYTETIDQGVTGFRCRRLSEFLEAMEGVKKIPRKRVNKVAVKRWTCEKVRYDYQDYFQDILDLTAGKNWWDV